MRKRSFTLSGHRTSVALEEPFWDVLEDGARRRGLSLAALVEEVDARRSQLGGGGLASALRLHALALAQASTTPPASEGQATAARLAAGRPSTRLE